MPETPQPQAPADVRAAPSAERQNRSRHMYDKRGPYAYEPFRWLAWFAVRVDFPCYSLLENFQRTEVFPTCIENDPHRNPAGHRVAAEAIIRILEENNYLRPIP